MSWTFQLQQQWVDRRTTRYKKLEIRCNQFNFSFNHVRFYNAQQERSSILSLMCPRSEANIRNDMKVIHALWNNFFLNEKLEYVKKKKKDAKWGHIASRSIYEPLIRDMHYDSPSCSTNEGFDPPYLASVHCALAVVLRFRGVSSLCGTVFTACGSRTYSVKFPWRSSIKSESTAEDLQGST